MKFKTLFTFAAVLATATLASADTEIRITGSTAFRPAVHAGLLNSFFSTLTKYGHSNGAGLSSLAAKSVWQGTVTGMSGTVTVRCTWSGSTGGIAAVAAGTNVSFLNTPAGAGENPSLTASTNLPAHIAMSDVAQESTVTLSPTLTDEPAGVIPFIPVVNDTSATGATTLARYGFDNVTAQFMRALLATGSQPKSMLTGVTADSSKTIYSIGRNKSSGTRVAILAELKYGIFEPLNHWLVAATGDAVTSLQVWPVSPATGGDTLASNGGYTGGDLVALAMANKTDVTFNKLNSTGGAQSPATDVNAHLISILGLGDALNVVTNGGALLKYEGQSYTGTADDDLVRNGQYTMWSYQHLMYVSLDDSTQEQTLAKNQLLTAIEANISGSGIAAGTMNVYRTGEGGAVGP